MQIYLESTDGIGGADTNSRKVADALIITEERNQVLLKLLDQPNFIATMKGELT